MTPQPADNTCLIWSGRKKTSVALLGTRSTVEPNAYKGLNAFTTWLGAASTLTVCAAPVSDHVKNQGKKMTHSELTALQEADFFLRIGWLCAGDFRCMIRAFLGLLIMTRR